MNIFLKIKSSVTWLYQLPGGKFFIDLFFVIIPIAFAIRTFGFGLYQVPSCSMETTLLVGERFFSDKFTPLFMPIKRGDIIAFNQPPATYQYSDNLLVNLWQRYVYGPENWTKRVIGIPGDHLVGTIENGHPVVYLNGNKLDEPYINSYPLLYLYRDSAKSHNSSSRKAIHPVSFDPTCSYDNQPFYRINPELVVSDSGKKILIEPGSALRDDLDIFDVTLKKDQYWVMGDNRLGSRDSREWGPLEGNYIHGKIVFCIWSMDTQSSWWMLDLLVHPINFWKNIRWSRCMKFVH